MKPVLCKKMNKAQLPVRASWTKPHLKGEREFPSMRGLYSRSLFRLWSSWKSHPALQKRRKNLLLWWRAIWMYRQNSLGKVGKRRKPSYSLRERGPKHQRASLERFSVPCSSLKELLAALLFGHWIRQEMEQTHPISAWQEAVENGNPQICRDNPQSY